MVVEEIVAGVVVEDHLEAEVEEAEVQIFCLCKYIDCKYPFIFLPVIDGGRGGRSPGGRGGGRGGGRDGGRGGRGGGRGGGGNPPTNPHPQYE